jgi:PAS domain S-box-containing protein
MASPARRFRSERVPTLVLLGCGGSVAALGAMTLVGWLAQEMSWVTLGAEQVPMAPLTAGLFLLMGAAILLVSVPEDRPWRARVAGTLAAIVILAAGSRLVLHFLSYDWVGEHLGVPMRHLPGVERMGHMLPAAALFFLLAGLALLALQVPGSRRMGTITAGRLVALVLWGGFVAFLVRYLVGAQLLYPGWRVTPALGTVVGMAPISVALYFLCDRAGRRRQGEAGVPELFLGIFAVVGTGIVVAASLYFNSFEKQIHQDTEERLVGALGSKARRIAEWRAERLSDGDFFFENPVFAVRARRLLTSAADESARRYLKSWLDKVRSRVEYDEFRLLDRAGGTLVAHPDEGRPVDRQTLEMATAAMRLHRPVLQDLYWQAGDKGPRLAVVVPVGEEPGQEPVAVVALRIDPAQRLFRMVDEWPVRSEQVEVALVRRAGSRVELLNARAEGGADAAFAAVPLDRVDAAVVRAQANPAGLFTGLNRRGQPVLAAQVAMPDSPWELVAMIGREEADAPLRERMVETFLLVVVVLFGVGSGLGVVWREQRARLLRDRLRTAEALRESEGRFSSMLATMPLSVVILDRGGRIVVCNECLLALTGWTRAELVGRSWFEVFPLSERRTDRAMERFRRAADTGRIPARLESPLVTRAGVRRLMVWNITVLRDASGEFAGVAGIGEDITEHKALEAQLRQAQKMEVVGQLAGGVAHDFNNILTAVTLNVELLRELALPREAQQPVEEIQGMARRAAALTQQLLMFARRQAIQVSTVELNAALTNLLKMVRRLLGEQVSLHFVPGAQPLLVEADPGMLDQAVLNLCINARDAMPAGGTLTLATEAVELDAAAAAVMPDARPGKFCCLVVKDTGVGMPPDVLQHLFEPFFTTKEVGKGTGLGLASLHGIVHQHQGWVTVASVVGEGTTFRIFLPASPKMERAASASAHAAAPMPGGHETILLVEDEGVVRKMTTVVLERLGYRVIAAVDGREARRRWEEHAGQIDLLFADMVMPGGVSGLQLGEELRQQRRGLKILLMSGYSSEIIRGESLAEAGIVFLPKPFSAAALAQAVRRCCDDARADAR